MSLKHLNTPFLYYAGGLKRQTFKHHCNVIDACNLFAKKKKKKKNRLHLALFMISSALQTFSDTDQAQQNAEPDEDPK